MNAVKKVADVADFRVKYSSSVSKDRKRIGVWTERRVLGIITWYGREGWQVRMVGRMPWRGEIASLLG